MRKVAVFDTTLRDGEQAPGASLSPHAKFLVARALADLGVDVLEAGFPAASVGEAEAVARIAREVRGPTMAALARASASDVEAPANALSRSRTRWPRSTRAWTRRTSRSTVSASAAETHRWRRRSWRSAHEPITTALTPP